MNLKLSEYIDVLEKNGLVGEVAVKNVDKNISFVTYNSKDAIDLSLFVCKGAHFKEQYLFDAIAKGAVCYISEKKYDCDADCIIVNDIRRTMAIIFNMFYDGVWKKLNLVGITGTKGKSTTTYFIRSILDEYQMSIGKNKTAIISSIDTYDGVESFESHITTPEVGELMKHFNNAVNSKIDYLTMEVSSQALKYDRVYGVEFDIGVYLNIGEDHISDVEHPDFDDYFYSKMKIFNQSKSACVSLDTRRVEEVLECCKNVENVLTFSMEKENADVFAYNIKKVGNDTEFSVKTPEYEKDFVLTVPGLFNVQNALAAISVCYLLGVPEEFIYEGLKKAKSSGRMEIYQNKDNSVIAIVDYAHNKMSFESLYESVLKEFPNRRIVTVFGCPGKKAFQRRKDLGELSGRYSDMVYLTEEDAGEEPVVDICREIAKYVEQENCLYEIEPDRGVAIKKAILSSDRNSIILITGKGNETRQKRGTEYIDCPTDVEYAKKFLKEFDERRNG